MREEKYTDMSLTDEQASLLGFKSFTEPEQYIQVKDVRYTLDEFNRISELLLGRNLTDDQQEVLEWLKWKRQEGSQPIECLYALAFGDAIESIIIAYINLTDTEQFQVLAAFAEWGMANE